MKILYFFPHAIYPTKTGAHVRAIQTLSSLSRLGEEVHLATFRNPSYPWTASPKNAVGRFLCRSINQVPRGLPWEPPSIKPAPMRLLFERQKNDYLPDYFGYTGGAAREWIQSLITRWEIDTIIIPYPVYSGLIPQTGKIRRVLELYDLWTLNSNMQAELQKGFKVESYVDRDGNEFITDSEALDPDFLERKNVKVSPFEKHVISLFPSAIALSHQDETLLKVMGPKNISRIPVMIGIPSTFSRGEGRPCMALGPNLLNLQGLAHFCHRILPKIVSTWPDFHCDLYGTVPMLGKVALGDHIINQGFAPDFAAVMEKAGFFINPVFSGTGMQIKTIEAMSYGLAPVCHARIAKDAGIIHLENGWVAQDETEFAEGVLILSKDEVLRKKLGCNARATIASSMSESQLDSLLEAFMAKARSLP